MSRICRPMGRLVARDNPGDLVLPHPGMLPNHRVVHGGEKPGQWSVGAVLMWAERNPAIGQAGLLWGRPGMFAAEVYAAVRRFVFVEGHSRREAARASRPTSARRRSRGLRRSGFLSGWVMSMALPAVTRW
jgi:hypothetical protein